MKDPRVAIIEICIKLNAMGLNQGTSGNVSIRREKGMLITPTGVEYSHLRPEMIVPVADDGIAEGSLVPSSEWRMHYDIYKSRIEAQAVVLVHSPYATALSCHREWIPAFHYMVAVAGGENIRCADYDTFGTQALSDRMLEALSQRKACLLANHGQIAFGSSLGNALWLANEVETLAKQYLLARGLGMPVLLDSIEMKTIVDRFEKYKNHRIEQKK